MFVTLLILGLMVAAVIGGPLLTIWALNALFSLGITFTFKTWLAALWLGIVVGGNAFGSSSSSKK